MNAKKVLIITYYWPPAGGPGVQRWLKFAKYLPIYGIEPHIYTPENPSYPLIDKSLEEEVPENIKLIKTKIWEPYQWAEKLNKKNKQFKAGQFDIGKRQSFLSKFSIWVRGNFFIPDARIFWVKPSIRFLEKHLKNNDYEAIITTGPPHSMHLIGLGLKKTFPHIKWLADFRDPWTEISYYKHLKLTKYTDKKHHFLEKEVFKNADLTIATSYTDAKNFKNKGANSICITNGYDTEITPTLEKTNHFTMSYVGVLEQLRNPKVLWEILEEIVNENNEFKNDFQLKLVGKIDEAILKEWKTLKNNTIYKGYLTHKEAIKEMKNTDLLLLTNFPNASSKGIIPGKLFEYLASQKTIISFGYQDSDVSKIIEKTHTGKHFTYTEKQKTKRFIMEEYEKWKNNDTSIKKMDISEFSRKNLTKKLSEFIHRSQGIQ